MKQERSKRRLAVDAARLNGTGVMFWTLLSVTAFLAAACTGGETSVPVSESDWPSYGLDYANSVHNRAESVLSPHNVSDLVEVWRAETGGVTGTPTVVDGVAYFADWEGFVYAIAADDGSVVWGEKPSEAPISSSVTVTDDLVVAGDLNGELHALGRDDGSRSWSTQLNPQGASLFASPVVIEDMVVIGMTDSEVRVEDPDFRASIVAVSLEDGSEIWRLYTDPGDVPERWVTIWSSAAYDPDLGLIYLGTGNTNQSSGGDEDCNCDLPLADGVLAIDHDSGEIAWFFKLIEEDKARDLDVGASPNLFTIGDRDVVGVGGKSGDYLVLDRVTGELVWKNPLTAGSAAGGVMATAAIGESVIYVASNDGMLRDGTIFALDASDGSILWQQVFDDAFIGGSMALANDLLYRGTFGGTALALDTTDGTVLWTDDVNARLAGGFSIVDGTLYVGYGSGVPGNLTAPEGGVIAYRLP
jgi:polyvinyl alcohol dehydrogenase (cytochrome)